VRRAFDVYCFVFKAMLFCLSVVLVFRRYYCNAYAFLFFILCTSMRIEFSAHNNAAWSRRGMHQATHVCVVQYRHKHGNYCLLLFYTTWPVTAVSCSQWQSHDNALGRVSVIVDIGVTDQLKHAYSHELHALCVHSSGTTHCLVARGDQRWAWRM